jgi:hypothetical protein
MDDTEACIDDAQTFKQGSVAFIREPSGATRRKVRTWRRCEYSMDFLGGCFEQANIVAVR